MELTQNIKNPSLVPNWFIYSGDKVAGIHDANGNEYQFVGASEKGEDGKTPILYISADDCRWYADYRDGRGPILVSQSPAASGLVGPQGETGLSGDSVKVGSIVNENGGTTVTLAWGENFSATSSFFVPSGLSGANGKDGTNGTDGKDGQNGISPTVTTAIIQSDTTHKNGGIEVTISGADGEHKYSAWNGNNGETAGALPMYGGTGLNARLNGSQYNIDFSADYLAAIQSVSSKLNTNAFNEYTGTTAPNTYLTQASADTLYQAKGNYISSANFDDDKVYGYTTEGWTAIDVGNILDAGSGISIQDDKINAKIGTDLTFDDVTSAIKIDTNGTANNTATNNRNFVEGSWTVANGYNCHAEGAGTSALGYGVHAQGMWTCFSSSKWGDNTHSDTDIYWAVGAGAAVEGYCNATTSCPMSGTTEESNYGAVHGGILKVIGNGYIEHDQYPDPDAHSHTHHPSDALILYRDGSLSAAGKISAAGIELGADPDLSDYIPYSAISLPIGTNNNVTDYSMGIGYSNTANYGNVTNPVQYGSLAFGYQNSASKMSFAAGTENKALHVGFAVGYHCTATEHAVAMNNNCSANDFSFAEGNNNKANKNSFAGGLNCVADDYSFVYGEGTSAVGRSFTYGPANTAYNYSHLFGRGLEYSGASTAGYNLGAFVIGGWNATTSYATTADAPLFIIGNGSTDSNKSDAFIVYRNGAVSEGTSTIAKGVNSHAEGIKTSAYGGQSHAEGNATYCLGNASHTEGMWSYTSGQGDHAEGVATTAVGYGIHAQGCWTEFSSTFGDAPADSTGDAGSRQVGVFVGGICNATTAHDYGEATAHNGVLAVFGNGIRRSSNNYVKSDAYVLYRDGTVSAKQFQNADGTETINGTTYNFSGADNIEILPNAATASTANFPNDNVIRIILEA